MLCGRLPGFLQFASSTNIKLFQNLQNKLLFHTHIACRGAARSQSSGDEDLEQIPYVQYSKSRRGEKRVYVWGMAEHGALGYLLEAKHKRSERSSFNRPLRLHFAYDHPVSDIACGYGFTVFGVATDKKEKVFGCGTNLDGQIGYHDPRRSNPLGILLRPVPVNIPFKNPTKVKLLKLGAGRAHTAIVSTAGVHLMGNNAYGQCGRPIVDNEDYVKNKLPAQYFSHLGDEQIVSVCCGQDHSMFITKSGKVYACGWGADGQTGLGHYQNEWKPSLVKGDILNEKIVKISCAADCVLALNDKGEVFAWGNAEYGQIFDNDGQQQVNTPLFLKPVNTLGKILDIASGGTNCAVLNEEGKVFTWGFGIMGNGPKVQRNPLPTLIPPPLFGCNELQPETRVVKIESGLSQFAAVTNSGNLYAWGRNNFGQLGLGHLKDQYFPLQVSVGAFVKDVRCGVDHTVAIAAPFV